MRHADRHQGDVPRAGAGRRGDRVERRARRGDVDVRRAAARRGADGRAGGRDGAPRRERGDGRGRLRGHGDARLRRGELRAAGRARAARVVDRAASAHADGGLEGEALRRLPARGASGRHHGERERLCGRRMPRLLRLRLDHRRGRDGGDVLLPRQRDGEGRELRRDGRRRADAEGDGRRRPDLRHGRLGDVGLRRRRAPRRGVARRERRQAARRARAARRGRPGERCPHPGGRAGRRRRRLEPVCVRADRRGGDGRRPHAELQPRAEGGRPQDDERLHPRGAGLRGGRRREGLRRRRDAGGGDGAVAAARAGEVFCGRRGRDKRGPPGGPWGRRGRDKRGPPGGCRVERRAAVLHARHERDGAVHGGGRLLQRLHGQGGRGDREEGGHAQDADEGEDLRRRTAHLRRGRG